MLTNGGKLNLEKHSGFVAILSAGMFQNQNGGMASIPISNFSKNRAP